ncbi:MAG: helix-turn-helix domain-containing protein [Candidatus Cloacimonetes bacterium]|nr:helix-turn-helix domain-containing protein [Candidatus Cloacimonadota bacterium]
MTTFDKRLKVLRVELDKKQVEMASEIGVSSLSLCLYETGRCEPNMSFLNKLNLLYNVNLNWLITGEGNMFDFVVAKKK